jgi:hypothetical protein
MCTTFILPSVNGSPRYVIGKPTLFPTNPSKIWSRFRSELLIGATVHFS